MADPKTPKPKTSKPKTPKAKPTPPGQGLMDFNGKPPLSGETTSWRRQTPLNPNMSQSGGQSWNETRWGSRSSGVMPVQGRGPVLDRGMPGPGRDGRNPNLESRNAQHNAVGPNNPQTRAGMGGRPMVSSPVTQPGAPLQRVNNPGITRTPTPPRTGGSFGSGGNQATGKFREVQDYKKPSGLGAKSRTPARNIVELPTPPSKSGSFGSGGVKRTGPFTTQQTVTMPTGLGNRGGKYSGPKPGDSTGRRNMGFGSGPYVKGQNPIINPGAPLERITPGGPLGPVRAVDKIDDAAKIVGGAVKSRPKGRFGLLAAAAAGATALGAGYLMSRRNENEDAAKPQQAGANVSIPGRNAPPSSGNEADRSLYPAAGGGESSTGGGTASKQPSLTDRVRGNNKANRNPTEYLGEAFDATVKRGRDVGRKHLQGMLVRDSVDESTARNLIARYDKEIGSQRTLKDYKSEGIAQKFDRENPGKAGRILDEYRGMGRREGAAPAGATYAQIKERALR